MFEKKLDTDPYLEKLAASDPELYNELLLELSKRPETNQALTLHESTPVEILRIIASKIETPAPYWASGILSHPNCPPELIAEKLISGEDLELISIARNPSLNEEDVRVLAKSSYPALHTWICRRPDCPPDLLEEFFSICLKQWEGAIAQNGEAPEPDQSTSLFDDDLYFDDNSFQNAFYEVDKDLLEAIAANPNTPDSVFKKMMAMNLKTKWFDEGTLGHTLLHNPSVSLEDKAFLSLQGFSHEVSNIQTTSLVEHHGLPSSIIFQMPKFQQRFKEALNSVGHPSALLDPVLQVTDNEYNFNELVNEWIKHETIYRTLWPEILSEREDVFYQYRRSSYDGDYFYFSLKDFNFEHDFSRGSYGYNSMGYPFIDRSWAVTAENMSIEMSYENFTSRDMIEYLEGDDEDMYDLALAAVISQNSYEGEITTYSSSSGVTKQTVKAHYSITKKGEKYVCDWADSYFSEDADVEVHLFPEKARPYSWKALSEAKKDLITRIIIEGFNQKVDTKYQYAEHFLACIALHPDTPDSIRQSLSDVESTILQQALVIGNGKRKEN